MTVSEFLCHPQDAHEQAAPLFSRGDHAAQELFLSVRDRCDLSSVLLQDAHEQAAPLFGRGDHAAQEQSLSVRDRCDLLVRASFLVTVFLPFLLLGPILLLLAAQFAPSAPAQAQAASLGASPADQGTSEQQVSPSCGACPACLLCHLWVSQLAVAPCVGSACCGSMHWVSLLYKKTSNKRRVQRPVQRLAQMPIGALLGKVSVAVSHHCPWIQDMHLMRYGCTPVPACITPLAAILH